LFVVLVGRFPVKKEERRLENVCLTRLTKTIYGLKTASLCFDVIKTRLTAKTCPAGRLA
jgi:hypothetical protein